MTSIINIKVIIIDYYIKKLIEKLQEYKIHFVKYLSQALLNIKTPIFTDVIL